MKHLRLGVDLGGSKIEIIALDGDGRELLRRRVATPKDDYRATLDAIALLVGDAETDLGCRGTLGLGTPGSISRATGLLRGSNSVCLNGRPIKQGIEALVQREVRISNDANCFALSEAIDGAGRGAALVHGVILGTGVGSGIVIHGCVLEGANAIAGEWGHNPLPWPRDDERPGSPCYCGRRGCIETWLSGPGMERDHLEVTGERRAAQQIAAGADAGDGGCQATLSRFEERFARAIAHVINLFDPDVIVLGGGLSNISRLYTNVPRQWAAWVFSDRVDTKLVPNEHGDSSGVRGAAWLWGRPAPRADS